MKTKNTMTRIAQPILALARDAAYREGIFLKAWLEKTIVKAVNDKGTK